MDANRLPYGDPARDRAPWDHDDPEDGSGQGLTMLRSPVVPPETCHLCGRVESECICIDVQIERFLRADAIRVKLLDDKR